jgi:polyvinyl alcohol dehydrogenase (cytochrome)
VLVITLILGVGAVDIGGSSAAAPTAVPAAATPNRVCDWPMWGYSIDRPFATKCESEVSAGTVDKLRLRWFFNARDVVTATPAVVDGTVYVGDWSGRFYALRARNGKPRWTFTAKPERLVYSGQIVGSAAVAVVRGVRTVFVPSGKTMYALRASDGKKLWEYSVGRKGGAKDPSEIESSPVVADGKVIFGYDVHNSAKGFEAGVVALNARTGRQAWKLVTAPSRGVGATGAGCGDVWGSPAVDRERDLVIFGTGNCTDPDRWGRFSDAMVAASLETGAVRWTFQPHESNRDDLDFAGAPNLMDLYDADVLTPGALDAGVIRPVAGLGNKDGTYYIVDRTTGEQVAAVAATGPGLTRPGGNFSTGGFIGPAAYKDNVVVGGTAVGPAPYLHGILVPTGSVLWQNSEPSATYAATAIVNEIALVGGTDFTLRAVEVATGNVLWSHPMKGAVSGGAVITREHVFAVAGIREPGLDKRSRSSGVYRFSLRGKAAKIRIRPVTPSTTRGGTSAPQTCVGSPCDLGFELKKPPAGLNPTARLEVTERPFRIRVQATDLGPPAGWLRPGTPAAQAGATQYAVFISESDDNPTGGLVCVLDASFECTGTQVPRRGATYNRVSIVAVKDRNTVPTLVDGFERLVTTQSFDPPLAPVGRR